MKTLKPANLIKLFISGSSRYVAFGVLLAVLTSGVAFAMIASKPHSPATHVVAKTGSAQPRVKSVVSEAAAKPTAQPQTDTAARSNTPQPQAKPARDDSGALPTPSIPTGISIGFVSKSTYKYIYFKANGYRANTYLFVITPVKTANPVSTYITENYIEEQPASGTPISQHGRGNPDYIPNMSTGDEFTVAICGEKGYLTCGSVVSNKIRLVVKDMTCFTDGGCDFTYEYK